MGEGLKPKGRIPLATYRWQFNRRFTLAEAAELVGYLAALGVSDLYASPLLTAHPESTHGYDVCRFDELNPVLGTPADLVALVKQLQAHGLGLLLDFVPNHMGAVVPLNPWWTDVLEYGIYSAYAEFFDIDWQPLQPALQRKVLLPLLADHYGRVLEQGELGLTFGDGGFWVTYLGSKLPLAPASYPLILDPAAGLLAPPLKDKLLAIITALRAPGPAPGIRALASTWSARLRQAKQRLADLFGLEAELRAALAQVLRDIQGHRAVPSSFDRLHAVFEAQNYRLSFWRYASREVNYRRFFDVDNLPAIRMERPEVFDAAHHLLLSWIRKGWVTGVRLDHIDGLWNPAEYLQRLQIFSRPERGTSSDDERSLYLLVEKILTPGENLRQSWPVHGTTGYDFASQVIRVLIDGQAEAEFTAVYENFIGHAESANDLVRAKKHQVMGQALSNEINLLANLAYRLAQNHRHWRDLSLPALSAAIRELVASLSVYRTYMVPGSRVHPDDRKGWQAAFAAAQQQRSGVSADAFEFLENALLNFHTKNGQRDQQELIFRFQQFTGPIMAKGFEDTFLYAYPRLMALNEVGGDPRIFGSTVEAFHDANRVRLRDWPHSLVSTSTHDTKLSEDVRARIAALTELPAEWARQLQLWGSLNAGAKSLVRGRPAPDPKEEYLFYQVLLGAWPLEVPTADQHEHFIQRLQQYMQKAVREAKTNSTWVDPDPDWEAALSAFIAAVLRRSENRFWDVFEPFAKTIAQLGVINSLSQTGLKLTVPGVPDIYQGNECWHFRLVDPDNRQPVNFGIRQTLLRAVTQTRPRDLFDHWRNSGPKMFLISQLLRFRRAYPELFQQGKYVPLETRGEYAECCLAFARVLGPVLAIVLAPRLSRRVGFPPVGSAWADTQVQVGRVAAQSRLSELLAGHQVSVQGGGVLVAEAMRDFPFAVLVTGLSGAKP